MGDPQQPFDRKLVRRHRERAAAALPGCDFLFREAAARLADRLHDVRRAFPLALDLGCHDGILSETLQDLPDGKIGRLVQADLSPRMAAAAAANGRAALAADEEALPFGGATFDLIVSCASLHWVNDLPGALAQIRHALKPDGLFLAVMFGGETLHELRRAWLEAEIAAEGGAGLHVGPYAELADIAGLLQRAGFSLPVADTDRIDVSYDNALKLMAELRAMGESAAAVERRRTPIRRATLMAVAQRYHDLYAGADGRIPASFQLLYMTGWAPHASQQQPLRPGTAAARLADALGSSERSAGEKPGRG